MIGYKFQFILMATVAISGCVSYPEGPSSLVLPGSSQTLAQFNIDNNTCQQFAFSHIGSKGEAINKAAQNTLIGAAVGAVIGSAITDNHHGGVLGAGVGALIGTEQNYSNGRYASNSKQNDFDNAYIQCMYSRGHRVPVRGEFVTNAAPEIIEDTIISTSTYIIPPMPYGANAKVAGPYNIPPPLAPPSSAVPYGNPPPPPPLGSAPSY